MIKNELYDRALEIFMESKGDISLKAIAKSVGVSPTTVARWCRNENWKIKAAKAFPTTERPKGEWIVVRKKALFEKAVKMFKDSGGKISNGELGRQLKVTKKTIAEWKKTAQWKQAVARTVVVEPSSMKPLARVALPSKEPHPSQAEVGDLGPILSYQDLIALNERLRSMLGREFLTAAEIEQLSNAKLSLLKAAEAYLGIANTNVAHGTAQKEGRPISSILSLHR
jgi:uncharacterized protein YjcR